MDIFIIGERLLVFENQYQLCDVLSRGRRLVHQGRMRTVSDSYGQDCM